MTNTEVEVKALVADHQEATRMELCELFAIKTGNWVSRTAMCRCVQKLGVHRKKTWYSSQAATERVQKLRVEYWERIKDIEPENKRIFGENRDSTGCDQNSGPFTADDKSLRTKTILWRRAHSQPLAQLVLTN